MTATLTDRRTTSIAFPGPLLDLLQTEASLNRVSLGTVVRKYVELSLTAAASVTDQERSFGQVRGLPPERDDLESIVRM